MKRAYCDIREQPHYRSEAFIAGLKACGFVVLPRQLPPVAPGPDDVLVIWNRYGAAEATADKWEKQGGKVLVAENGYLGRDANGVQYYALARSGHNGSGWWPWPAGGPERFSALGVELKPWRAAGEHVYVRGQRGIGSKTMASPQMWHQATESLLKKTTKRRIVVREHPGKPANELGNELAAELSGAHACVIWSSAVGVKALVEGIPVFYNAPHWICAGAAKKGLGELEAPLMDDVAREVALERMAWAQWSVAELATGEPFMRLLS